MTDPLGDPLDDGEGPPDDGAADDTATVICPYCSEPVEIALDSGGGADQSYVEDCQVCCRPWQVTVHYGEDGGADVFVEALE